MEVIYEDNFLNQEFIEANFEDGYAGYTDFFEDQLSFPQKSYKNQVEGLMLFYFEIFPNKDKIEVTFLTRLDEHIEHNIRAAVQTSKPKWSVKGEGPFRVYQPIIYSLLPYYPQTLIGDLPDLPADIPLKFHQMFILIKSKRIDPDFDITTKKDSAEVSENVKKSYVKALAQYEKMMALGEHSHAYEALNPVIRYNPLNKDFLKSRIKLEQDLGLNRFQAYDSRLLSDFVDSLDLRVSSPNVRTNFSQQLDTLYSEGQNAYEYFMQGNMAYPPSAITKGNQGLVMVAIKYTKASGVEFELLTKIDDDIEKVLQVLYDYNRDKWDKKEQDYILFQPIFFSLNQMYPSQLVNKIPGFKNEFKFPILEPIFSNAYQFPPKQGVDLHLKEYSKAKAKMETNVKKGKTKKAVEFLNVLIRYNPFDESLIKMRIEFEKELGTSIYSTYDQQWLTYLPRFK